MIEVMIGRQPRQRDRDAQVADRLRGDAQQRQPEQALRAGRQVEVAADRADDARGDERDARRSRSPPARPAGARRGRRRRMSSR